MKKLLMTMFIMPLFVMACGKGTETGTQVLKLSHNHATGYPVDLGYQKFAEIVKEKSEGRFEIEIYPSSQLGESKPSVELAQSGVIQFAHISSAALESFDETYSVFNLPYVFKDYNHYRTVMDSSEVRQVFEDSISKGFVTLLYLEGGARSIYTKSKAINTPSDLAGMKIRVQDSPIHIEMMRRLGATPVALNFSEVYTALQQGVIDGAENNAPSLVQTGHSEVAKFFSLNEHQRLSDFLLVGAPFWNSLSDEDKQMFRDSANETIEYFVQVWADAENAALDQARNKDNVSIVTVDQAPFRALMIDFQNEFAKRDPKYNTLLQHIRSLEN